MIRKGDLQLSCSGKHNPTFTTEKKKQNKTDKKGKATFFLHIFAYLFIYQPIKSYFISLKGLFIFFFHCLGNSEVNINFDSL